MQDGVNAENVEEEAVEAVRLWGPVESASARMAGALAAASSVLLKPTRTPMALIGRLHALIPTDVLPRTDDTAETLRARIASSRFFHPTWILKHGHGRGRRYVELTTTAYPQPRRVQWVQPVAPEHVDGDGEKVVQCLVYPHLYTRSLLDRWVEVMPPAVEELVKYAVRMARPLLTPASRASTPNFCEMCVYYTAFGGKMGRHRDNFDVKDLAQYLCTRDVSILTRQVNTQRANTNVLIWSLGTAPMVLQLSFPQHAGAARDRSRYMVHPAFSVPCGEGTLFVFSPTDDLFYCHEVFFDAATLEAHGASAYRCAFVIRWLSPVKACSRSFYARWPLYISESWSWESHRSFLL